MSFSLYPVSYNTTTQWPGFGGKHLGTTTVASRNSLLSLPRGAINQDHDLFATHLFARRDEWRRDSACCAIFLYCTIWYHTSHPFTRAMDHKTNVTLSPTLLSLLPYKTNNRQKHLCHKKHGSNRSNRSGHCNQQTE